MDVVYNHTANNAPFNPLVPRYYYRFLPDGSYSNGSGCGNDFRTEAPMARKYILDSLKFWVQEYGIDGFRFDLMALIDLDTMKDVERELRALNPNIVLYGEPWGGGGKQAPVKPTNKQTIHGTRIGAFNDNIRNALLGSPFDKNHAGFIQDGSSIDNVQRGIEGSWRDWAPTPAQAINYLSCHDNWVVWDKLKLSKPAATDRELKDMMKLGYLLLFTSQGVPFLNGGEEFARTKFGHENSYNAPDNVNQVDWSLKQKNFDLFTYTRDLIALRKAHPVFRLRAKEQIAAWLAFHDQPNPGALLFTIDPPANGLPGEPWRHVCVIANSADNLSYDFALPAGPLARRPRRHRRPRHRPHRRRHPPRPLQIRASSSTNSDRDHPNSPQFSPSPTLHHSHPLPRELWPQLGFVFGFRFTDFPRRLAQTWVRLYFLLFRRPLDHPHRLWYPPPRCQRTFQRQPPVYPNWISSQS